jgi:alkaline phosphatase D
VSYTGTFKTLHPRLKRCTLVLSTCIKPFYPYNPLDYALSIREFDYLSQYLEITEVDMMLLRGDFICIHLPKWFGYEIKHYTYHQVYISAS